jgi:hypothetical protein
MKKFQTEGNCVAVYNFDNTIVRVCDDYYRDKTPADIQQTLDNIRDIYINSIMNQKIAEAGKQ